MKRNGIKDVAEMANVSTTTVSFVYNNPSRVNEKTRKIVLKAAKKLNYTPNFNASGLRGKTNLVTLIINFDINELSHPTIMEAIPYISKQITSYGYYLLPFFAPEEREISHLTSFAESKQVCGAIFMASKNDLKLLDLIIKNEIPTVVIGDIEKYYKKVFSIDIDNVKETKSLVNKIYRYGYKNIAYIGGSMDYIVCQQRLKGYSEGIKENNIQKPMILGLSEKREEIESAVKKMLKSKYMPDAILCKDDIKAAYVIHELSKNGIKAGKDIGVVGIGGIQASSYISPSLSSLSFPIKSISKLSVSKLNDMIVNNTIITGQKYVNTEFIARESLENKISDET